MTHLKMALCALLLLCSAAALAGNDDEVLQVYSCGSDVGIQMKNAGWVVVLESQVGQKRADRMLAVALALLNSGKKTGYFNQAEPIHWCGVPDARPITVLGAKAAV